MLLHVIVGSTHIQVPVDPDAADAVVKITNAETPVAAGPANTNARRQRFSTRHTAKLAGIGISAALLGFGLGARSMTPASGFAAERTRYAPAVPPELPPRMLPSPRADAEQAVAPVARALAGTPAVTPPVSAPRPPSAGGGNPFGLD